MEYLKDKLSKQGLEIYDVTPDLHKSGGYRGREINKWLENHQDLNINNWVVLDDEFFPDYYTYDINEHLVETFFYSEHGGLTDDKVEEAIRILKDE